MPELPEVETVRRGLEPVMRGRRFVHVTQRRKDLRFPLPERFAERLTGRKVERLDRRAKYILIHLDGAEVLAVHLGMTGRFQVELPARRRRPPSPLVGEGRGGGSTRGNPPPLSPPHKGEGDFSSATTPTSTATTPSTITSCSRCRAAPASPSTTPAVSAT